MDDLSSKKRKIPRHVDGRIMVGMIPLKNFFIMLPFAIAIIVFVIRYFSPLVFFIGVLLLGITVGLFSEFHQRETGFLLIKNIIIYSISGDRYFERNTNNVSFSKRFTRFKREEEKGKES